MNDKDIRPRPHDETTVGLVAAALLARRESLGIAAEALFGIFALPLGLPALYDARRRYVHRE